MPIPPDGTPGWEGSVGPFPSQYGRPHVYARDVQSGAGNCVCGRQPEHRLHVPVPSAPLGTWGKSCPCCLGDRGTVCDACGQHACWAGQFMCEDAHGAGVTTERAEVRDAQ